MKNKEIISSVYALLIVFLFSLPLFAQVFEEQTEQQDQTSAPRAVDFTQMFDQEETTREEYSDLMRRKKALIEERMNQPDALEGAINAEQYIVGPGDIFNFKVLGALENQIPIEIAPEGNITIPSVGDIHIAGLTLKQAQDLVEQKAGPYYKGSDVSLTLESLRYCRVHVTGAVVYPGTYVTQAINRISTLIAEAGGVSENANKGEILLKRKNGLVSKFDLSRFEQSGSLDENIYVTGGDVIFVPPVDLSKPFVRVEGDFETGGLYQIMDGESLFHFLQRIRAVKRNTDITKVMVVRNKKLLLPFSDSKEMAFSLMSNDVITIPSSFVYVKGAVRNPGAYPYIQYFTTKDYAGMAGGDYQSGSVNMVKVFKPSTGKTKKGTDIVVEPGDVVDLPTSWDTRVRNWGTMLSAIASSVLAAKAIGIIGN